MPIDQMIHLLRDLRLGKLDAATTKVLGGTPLGDLVSNLLNSFPVLFQERVVGRKREVGMCAPCCSVWPLIGLPVHDFNRWNCAQSFGDACL